MRVELSNFQHPLLCRRGHLAMQSKPKDKVSLTMNFCLYYTIILYVKLLQSFYSQLKRKDAKKNVHNAWSLQENLVAANQ